MKGICHQKEREPALPSLWTCQCIIPSKRELVASLLQGRPGWFILHPCLPSPAPASGEGGKVLSFFPAKANGHTRHTLLYTHITYTQLCDTEPCLLTTTCRWQIHPPTLFLCVPVSRLLLFPFKYLFEFQA